MEHIDFRILTFSFITDMFHLFHNCRADCACWRHHQPTKTTKKEIFFARPFYLIIPVGFKKSLPRFPHNKEIYALLCVGGLMQIQRLNFLMCSRHFGKRI